MAIRAALVNVGCALVHGQGLDPVFELFWLGEVGELERNGTILQGGHCCSNELHKEKKKHVRATGKTCSESDPDSEHPEHSALLTTVAVKVTD